MDKYTPPANDEKEVRAPIGEETTVTHMGKKDKIRAMMGAQLKLDASYYLRLPEYKDFTLYWANDEDGNVETQLDAGAQLVERKARGMNRHEGFAGRKESQYECHPAGVDGSNRPMNAYLLALPTKEYEEYRIKPKEARNKLLMKSMGIGKAPIDQKVMPHINGVQTYAPNNPIGNKQGFEQFHDA